MKIPTISISIMDHFFIAILSWGIAIGTANFNHPNTLLLGILFSWTVACFSAWAYRAIMYRIEQDEANRRRY
jgi:hypothetical protein